MPDETGGKQEENAPEVKTGAKPGGDGEKSTQNVLLSFLISEELKGAPAPTPNKTLMVGAAAAVVVSLLFLVVLYVRSTSGNADKFRQWKTPYAPGATPWRSAQQSPALASPVSVTQAANAAGTGTPVDVRSAVSPRVEALRAQTVAPLRYLLNDMRNSDAQRYWQGAPMSDAQALDAVNALATRTALETERKPYPLVLVPYVRQVAQELRGYLKVTDRSIRTGNRGGEMSGAASQHLGRAEGALQQLDMAVTAFGPDIILVQRRK